MDNPETPVTTEPVKPETAVSGADTADEPETRRIRLRGRATILGAVALTAAGTMLANTRGEGVDPVGAAEAAVESIKKGEVPDIDVSLTMQDVGVGGLRLPAVEVGVAEQPKPPEVVTRHATPQHDIHMRWAERFAEDPEARELSQKAELRALRHRLSRLHQAGWGIEGISVQGFASMEDDYTAGDNPGFGIDSPKNRALARVRSEAVAPRVERAFEAATDRQLEVNILPGKEQDDPKLAKSIEQVADELGYSTVELVKTYNRNPESLPQDARIVLDGLQDQRFVRVLIKAKQTKEVPADNAGGNFVLIPLLIPLVGLSLARRPKVVTPAGVRRKVEFRPPPLRPEPVLVPSGHIEPIPIRRKQPRPYNFHFQDRGGRESHMGRDRGGSRSGKRSA